MTALCIQQVMLSMHAERSWSSEATGHDQEAPGEVSEVPLNEQLSQVISQCYKDVQVLHMITSRHVCIRHSLAQMLSRLKWQ